MVNVGRNGAANLNGIQEVECVKQEATSIYLLRCFQKTSPPVLVLCKNKTCEDFFVKWSYKTDEADWESCKYSCSSCKRFRGRIETYVRTLKGYSMCRCGSTLFVKNHTHTFVNTIGELDFSFPIGEPLGMSTFLITMQLEPFDKAGNALALTLSRVVKALVDLEEAMQDHVAYAQGFIDCDTISARCMLTKFSPCATQIEVSILRVLIGFPDVYLSGQIKNYILENNGRFHLRWGCRQIPYD